MVGREGAAIQFQFYQLGTVNMSSIILAGGKSSRFGWNKAVQTIGGKSLVQRVIDSLVRLRTREIIIVVAQGDCLGVQRHPSFHSSRKSPNEGVLPEVRVIDDFTLERVHLGESTQVS